VDPEQLTSEEADACVDHTGKRGVVSLCHCVSGSFLGAPAGPPSTNPSSAKYRSRSAAPLGHGRRVIRTREVSHRAGIRNELGHGFSTMADWTRHRNPNHRRSSCASPASA
jgi:hypothetical protein